MEFNNLKQGYPDAWREYMKDLEHELMKVQGKITEERKKREKSN